MNYGYLNSHVPLFRLIVSFLVMTLSLSWEPVSAQEIQQSIDSAAMDYLRLAGSNSAIFNGNEYEMHPRTSNHPFLIDMPYSSARLLYNNVIYPEVYLRLDLNRDELIIRTPDLRNNVLFPENVGYALFHGKHIIYFQKDNLPGCPSSGYYILVHAGNCKVIEKRSAMLTEKIRSTRLERHFMFSTRFYLHIKGEYLLIKNKRDLLKAIYPYKKEIKQIITVRRLNFRYDPELFLFHTVNEYEKLTATE